MLFIEPTIHHVIYVLQDSKQIAAKPGFPFTGKTQSMWVSLEDKEQRRKLLRKLANLRRRGVIKEYFVGACDNGDGYYIEEMFEELDALG